MSPASKASTSKRSKATTSKKATTRKKSGGGATGKAAARSKTSSSKTKTKSAKATTTNKKAKAAKSTKAGKTASKSTPKAKTAPKSKSKAATVAPRKKRKQAPKAILAGLLEKLERAFGAVNLPADTESTVEKAVYLVLREGGSQASTERAMRSLREDFVDWNDVRLSRPSELARLMSNSSKAVMIRRLVGRCERIREMLDQIYNDRNEVNLEFLLDEKPKGQIEYLEDIDDLGIHNAYALAQWLSGDEKLVLVSPELCKVCQLFGITESAAMAKVRKELSDMLAPGQATAVQAHLNQLGDMDDPDWPGAVKEYLKEHAG
jgi:endonuclease III